MLQFNGSMMIGREPSQEEINETIKRVTGNEDEFTSFGGWDTVYAVMVSLAQKGVSEGEFGEALGRVMTGRGDEVSPSPSYRTKHLVGTTKISQYRTGSLYEERDLNNRVTGYSVFEGGFLISRWGPQDAG